MIVSKNSLSTDVGALQANLNRLGYLLVVDNRFGPKTHAALVSFQASHGLVPDGIAGPLTNAKIAALLKMPGPAPAPLPPVPAPAPAIPLGRVPGIDVSAYQPNTDWAKVAASGVKFAYIKATEGTGYVNAYFARDWAACKANGILRGAYCFFHSGMDAVAEAKQFLKIMGPIGPGDLPPMIDCEAHEGSPAQEIAAIVAFCDAVEKGCGKQPLVYIGSYYTDEIHNPATLGKYQWWVPHYGVPSPRVTKPWTTWTIWQYAGKNSYCPGVQGECDLDWFNGNERDLRRLAGL